MWRSCHDELLCDLAEVYHIYDPASIPCRMLAIYAAGLGEDSRVFMFLNNKRAKTSILLQAAIVDRLSMLVWFQTEDGQKGRNRPTSLFETLTGDRKESSEQQTVSYATAAEYEAARAQYVR